jgi:hypothetical protein
MKIFIIITGGRTGSGFLHSILDGHPQICYFPGEFFFDEFFESARKEKSAVSIAKLFCKEYKYFFDSRYNKFERFNKLGESKKDFFLVNKEKFIKYFIKFHKIKDNNKLSLLKNLHFAYAATKKENLKKKKILLLHLHHGFRLKIFKDLNYEILYTIRDPKTNLSSFFSSWRRYKKQVIDPWSYYFNMKRVIRGLQELKSYKNKIHVIKLEDMHLRNKFIVKQLCNTLKIKFEKILNYSTFHKKKWWGDMAMKKFLNGANKKFINKFDNSLFFDKDIYFIEKSLKNFMTRYNYPFSFKKKNYNYLYIIFPFKMEIIMFNHSLKNKKLKNIFEVFYFYIRRVLLFIISDIRQVLSKKK